MAACWRSVHLPPMRSSTLHFLSPPSGPLSESAMTNCLPAAKPWSTFRCTPFDWSWAKYVPYPCDLAICFTCPLHRIFMHVCHSHATRHCTSCCIGHMKVVETISTMVHERLRRDARSNWTANNPIYNIMHRGYTSEAGGHSSCPFDFYKNWWGRGPTAATVFWGLM